MTGNKTLYALQLVAVYGSWHLGQLQVGLSRAIRLTQCSSVRITTHKSLPMQMDGEPWQQPPAVLQVGILSARRLAPWGLRNISPLQEKLLCQEKIDLPQHQHAPEGGDGNPCSEHRTRLHPRRPEPCP